MSASASAAVAAGARPNGAKQSVSSPTAAAAASATAFATELERKRKLVRSVQILQQATKEQHCSEDDLVQALTVVAFADGEYVYCQGQSERDVYFIEEGRVLITQRRAGTGPARVAAQRRSVQEAELEIQIMAYEELEYFGEMARLQNVLRKSNAVASGGTTCMVLRVDAFDVLLAPLQSLMMYRHLLRAHAVLEKHRLFRDFTAAQRQYVLNHCSIEAYTNNDVIVEQGVLDDRYYILTEGEANIVIDEFVPNADSCVASLQSSSSNTNTNTNSNGTLNDATTTDAVRHGDGRRGRMQASVVATKSLYQGFGEMGLLDKPRTAHVVARGDKVVCAVVRRKDFIAASQLLLLSGSNHATALDADAESLLATTLIEEWNLAINARHLHLSNPHVAHYLVTFIKKFKAAYNQKFVGKTMYLDFLRRLHHEPALGDDFEFLTSRIAWDSPASSLSILRSETRRILSAPSATRTPAEMSFIGRLIESAAFLDKFSMPPNVDRHKVARHLGKVVSFLNVAKDMYLFRQGKIESRAFLILRGKIHIVNEDVNALHTVKHYEVIATLAAGDSFGELSLVTRLQRSATAMAPCDTDLVAIDREQLQQLMAALPGVDVRHEMVERAEFLSRLDFFRGVGSSDFGQCIRVAHDMQQVVYEPHHVFLREASHLRTLYIVKSGEIAVFLKQNVPLATTLAATTATNASSSAAAATASTNSIGPTRSVLVRVATIGPQEFFGVAIALAAITGLAPLAANSVSGTAAAVSQQQQQQQHPLLTATTQSELASTVFMCCTSVTVLELSERGWRRLTPPSLHVIRNAILERNRWHHALVDAQNDLAPPTYYHIDKPWHVLVRANPVTKTLEARQPTHLVRHVRDKNTKTTMPPQQQSSGTNPSSPCALFTSLGTSRASRSGGSDSTLSTNRATSPRRQESLRHDQQQQLFNGAPTSHSASLPSSPAAGKSPRSPSFATAMNGQLNHHHNNIHSNSLLGGSFASSNSPRSGAWTPHPPSHCASAATANVSLALPSSTAVSSLVSPTRSRTATSSSTSFVRILAPILPQALSPNTNSLNPSPNKAGRNVRSSPGRTDSSSSSPSKAFEAMWKLPRRPSLH